MIAAPSPVALTLPVIALVAQQAVKSTLNAYPGATFKVSGCRLTVAHYGTCSFYVIVHPSQPQQKGLQKCAGRVDIRNIGRGLEHRFIVKGCKPV